MPKFKYLILTTILLLTNIVFAYRIGGKGFKLKYVSTTFTENVYFTNEKILPIQLVIINDENKPLKINCKELLNLNLNIYSIPSKDYGNITGPDEEMKEDVSGLYSPKIINILGSKESRPSCGGIALKKYTSKIPEELKANSNLELFAEISVNNKLKDGYYQLHINKSRIFSFTIRNTRTDYDRSVNYRQKAEAYAYMWWDREIEQRKWIDKALKEIKLWLPYWWAFEEAESQMDIVRAKEILLEGIKKFPNPEWNSKNENFITDRLVVTKSRELVNGEMVFYDLYEKPFLEKILYDFMIKVNFDSDNIPNNLKEKFNKGLNVPKTRPIVKSL